MEMLLPVGLVSFPYLRRLQQGELDWLLRDGFLSLVLLTFLAGAGALVSVML